VPAPACCTTSASRARASASRRPGPAIRSWRCTAGGCSAAARRSKAATWPRCAAHQGDQGWSQKGPQPGHASRYYTQPQLQATARLELQGRTQVLHGRAWLDHEWADRFLDDAAVGWDWLGINLHDGAALTAQRIRRADGSALWALGSFRAAPDAGGRPGQVRSFSSDEVVFTPLRTWTSPATRTAYPVQWQVQTPVGRFTVNALLDAQEQDSRASTGTVYWEGLSELRDEWGRRVGLGYLELTGYQQRMRL
jgi:predicted secreted hydrolase